MMKKIAIIILTICVVACAGCSQGDSIVEETLMGNNPGIIPGEGGGNKDFFFNVEDVPGTVASIAKTYTFTVNCNALARWTIRISAPDNFLTLDKYSGTGPTTIIMSVNENTGLYDRVAIYDYNVSCPGYDYGIGGGGNITQEGIASGEEPPVYSISNIPTLIDAEGGVFNIKINCNRQVKWYLGADHEEYEFIYFDKHSGLGPADVVMTVPRNREWQNNRARVDVTFWNGAEYITDANYTVTQLAGKEPDDGNDGGGNGGNGEGNDDDDGEGGSSSGGANGGNNPGSGGGGSNPDDKDSPGAGPEPDRSGDEEEGPVEND